MTLAEILAEGRELCAKTHAGDAERSLSWSYDDGAAALLILPRLLQVAEAAVEMREAMDQADSVADGPGGTMPEIVAYDRLAAALAAFDAAAQEPKP